MISQDRYIKIVSSVGGAQVVSTRQFNLRLFSQSSVINGGQIYTFDNADDVATAFGGSTTEEAQRATSYFSFISKLGNSPSSISFYRWAANPTSSTFSGSTAAKSLTALQAVTAGELSFTINGNAAKPFVTGINLSAATDLTNVASLIQTALRATGYDGMTTATVTYSTTTNQFSFQFGLAGPYPVTPLITTDANEIGVLLGWDALASSSTGTAAQTALQAVQASIQLDNNFGSFGFIYPTGNLTSADYTAVAAWNHAQNIKYVFCISTPQSNAATMFGLLSAYSGTIMGVYTGGTDSQFVDQFPAEVLASIDYTAANSTQDLMWTQSSLRTASVTDETTANSMDAVRANYFGETDKDVTFYQRGVMMGGTNMPTDANAYFNEMWLKDYLATQFLEELLTQASIPGNTSGKSTLIGVLQSGIEDGLSNGVISSGKTLTTAQQVYITQLSGDSNAWRQVNTLGYWYNLSISTRENPNSGLSEKYATYTLIYSKDDLIRYIEGADVLI